MLVFIKVVAGYYRGVVGKRKRFKIRGRPVRSEWTVVRTFLVGSKYIERYAPIIKFIYPIIIIYLFSLDFSEVDQANLG